MFPTTSEQLLGLIRRSELASESTIQAWSQKYVAQELPLDTFCEELRKEATLSDWQLSQLLEGKSRGFFLGKYKLIRQLGAGAMGAVFLAEHRQMKHQVAIKVLAKRLLGKDRHLQRFEKEAQAAVRVNHPRIVRAYDLDQVGDVHFLVMEYVEGHTLQHWVLRDGPLPIRLAFSFARQIAEGLAAAHQGQLIHRDIKPANILVDQQQQIHLLDLGLARILDDDDESSLTLINGSRMIGTVDYLAPEQALDCHHIDGRADLYSLGCTLYYLLTGQPPFSEGTIPQRILAHQTQPPANPRLLREDCPEALAQVCLRLLAKKPEDRFDSALALIAAIDQAQDPSRVFNRSLAPALEVRIPVSTADESLLLAPEDPAERERSGEWKSQVMANRSAILAPRPHNPPPKKNKPITAAEPAAVLSGGDLFADLDGFIAASSNGSGSLSDLPALAFAGNGTANFAAPGMTTPDSLAAQALAKAREELAPSPSLRDRLLQVVAERGDGIGGFSYALWFLILFGALSGLILVGVTFVAVKSFRAPEIKQQNFERPS